MMKRLLRLLRTASLALLLAGTASAQTTGKIIGVVTDFSTGKPVAGALIVATSPNLQGEQTAVSDAQGNFRFDLLPPGQYKLTAQLDTYKPFERSDVVIRIDKTIRANLSLVPEAVQLEEQVVKTGAVAPVINVGSAETGTVVSKEFIATVPVGRSFDSAAVIAPNATADTYGVSFAGATSPENSYILDGMNVTSPADGRNVTGLLSNFIQEVDVKSGSFMAEYGRTTSGVVNAVTESGSNEFHGQVWGNYTPGFMSPAPKTLSRDAEAIARLAAPDRQYNADFGVKVGGPIMKDKLWFFAGLAPVLNRTTVERYYQRVLEDPNAPGQPLRNSAGFAEGQRISPSTFINSDATQWQVVGKLTYLVNADNTVTASAMTSPQSNSQLLSSNARLSNGLAYFNQNASDFIAQYNGKFLDRKLIVSALAGAHMETLKDDPRTVDGIDQRNTPAIQWTRPHSLTDFYTKSELGDSVFNDCQDTTGTWDPCKVSRFTTGGRGYMEDSKINRYAFKLSGSYLADFFGQHIAKLGVDMERGNYDKSKFYGGGKFMREINSSRFGPVFQDYRQFGLVENADTGAFRLIDPVMVNSITDSRSYYLQDSYTPMDGLTVSAGLRWETQDMFESGKSNKNLVINDNLAPRLQVVYDWTKRGRSAVKASWGRFYEMIPLDMADRSFGGETQVNALHSLCQTPGQAITQAGATAAGSCDLIRNGVYNYSLGRYATLSQTGGGVVPVSPDLKGQYVDMYSVGVEYEVLSDISAGITYEGRRLGRVIEDMSVDDGETYFIANPAESKPFVDPDGKLQNPRVGTTTDPITLRTSEVAFPKPDRRYDGVTLEVRKAFSNNWLAGASYTYSVFRGNYPGLFRAETGQLNPNILSEYDLVSLLDNKYGPLPSDIPHKIKLYGSYVWNFSPRFNVTGGAAFNAESGTPINYLSAHPIYGPSEAFALPRGSGGRTPFVTTMDLKGQLAYTIKAPYQLAFSVDVFNILNSQVVTSIDENWTYDSVKPIANGQCSSRNGATKSDPIAGAFADCPDLKYLTTTDGLPATVNRNFGKPTSYQLPMSIRFGVALSF